MASSTFLTLTLYLHAYYEVGVPRRRMSVMCTAYIVKMGVTCIISIYLIFSFFAFVFLGQNTWNQVTFGFTIGVACACSGHFAIKPTFLKFSDENQDDLGFVKIKIFHFIYVSTICLLSVIAAITIQYGTQDDDVWTLVP